MADTQNPVDLDVIVLDDDGNVLNASQEQDAISIPHDDGAVTIDFNPAQPEKKKSKFDDNLAEHIDNTELGRIAAMLCDAIDDDDKDRSEWLSQRADGLDLLGMKIERPGGGGVGTSSTAVAGQSTVRDPLLAEAIDRFQANSYAELCPSEGPCKAVNYGAETTEADQLAEAFEKDMNYYLTTTAREYYPDTRKMLFWVGYSSGMFKKVYKCPLRRRPVSESVDGADLIVPSNVTDLHNAGRITHQINMRQSVMRRMQILGVYRDVELTTPTPEVNVVQQKTADIVGVSAKQQRQEDQDYTVYECYCELDLLGFEHEEDGEPTGLPLPYRVTIDKDSQVILEIRRNWREDDPDQKAKIPFVLYPYATGLGIYGTGLLQRLGNLTMALTAMLRESIDAGMFANFPGFLFSKGAGRQLTNEFRVPPGGGAPIDVGTMPLRDAVMPLPYKDVSMSMVSLMGQVREAATRYGGTADSPTGEGVANAPVGSVLAAIDQATKIEGGVHKALHAAQREELELLKELFRDDPEALWRGNKRPAMGKDQATRVAKFKQALEDCELIPASDPNVPSHLHRLAKATAFYQIAKENPDRVDLNKAIVKWASMVRIDDMPEMMVPPQNGPPPMDPVAQKTLELKAIELQLGAVNDQANRESKENIEMAKLAVKTATTPEPTETTAEPVVELPEGPEPVDPTAIEDLRLKQEQISHAKQKTLIDAQNADKDREARLTEKAMDIAARLAMHQDTPPKQGVAGAATPRRAIRPPDGAQRPLTDDILAAILRNYEARGPAQ